MPNYDTQTPAGDGDEKLPITEEAKAAFAAAMDLTRNSTTSLRIYNPTTGTFYRLTLTGTLGNEYPVWTPEV